MTTAAASACTVIKDHGSEAFTLPALSGPHNVEKPSVRTIHRRT